MKAMLKFDLDEPADIDNHTMAVTGKQAYGALWKLDQELRGMIKYNGKGYLQEARDLLTSIMEDYNINFDCYK